MTRSISLARPMTGSSLPWRASSVRSRPKLSRAGVLLLERLADRSALPGYGEEKAKIFVAILARAGEHANRLAFLHASGTLVTIDLAAGDLTARVSFPQRIEAPGPLRMMLKTLADQARAMD